MSEPVLTFTDRGIYCPAGDFFIDPWRPVDRALITHGHADHARWGHGHYLATEAAAPVMRYRLGDVSLDTIPMGASRTIGGARVSFHPAGHIPGSAQIRVEVAGQVWVVSGDYKTDADRLSEPFEPVRCHAFITECTFGLPVFKWRPEAEIAAEINAWWARNAAEGRASVLGAYSLGKAQRVLSLVDPEIGPILTHGAVEATNAILRDQGLPLPATTQVTQDLDTKNVKNPLIIAPPSALGTPWMRRFGPSSQSFASGWMALRGVRRRRAMDRGFVISDHADWDGLLWAIAETGAEKVFCTHGYTDIFKRWLKKEGYDAHVLETEFGSEDSDEVSPETEEVRPVKAFADLFTAVDQTTKTTLKTKALAEYFTTAPDDDKLWTIALFSGRRPKRAVNTTQLREWAAERAGIPLWLLEESYPIVGDLAETIALVLPPADQHEDKPLTHWIKELKSLGSLEVSERRTRILAAWDRLETTERFLFNKLITGGFRIGVSQKLMTRALAQATGQEEAVLAHKLMGKWTPETTSFHALIEAEDPAADASRPYPFYLAYQLDDGPENIGQPDDWQAEWKWDGIRGQLLIRGAEHHVWSRGEELMTDRFPELARARDFLPDGTVLDGEIVAWDADAEMPMSFNTLQARIGRKTVPKKLLKDAPVILLAYDLLEAEGADLRAAPMAERRARLDRMLGALPAEAPVRASRLIPFDSWEALAETRATAREMRAEGVMLKRRDSPYLSGRKKGDWWKWKLDPLTIDAVMIYAQQGHGRRANLFTDFTFAVRDGDTLVPFTKAYSGLTDAEFRKITQWVRKNTEQRFGPVRQVTPHHVFEIAFEGIHESPRHKSGVALRFPRMSRWRQDKPLDEANTLDDLKAILAAYG